MLGALLATVEGTQSAGETALSAEIAVPEQKMLLETGQAIRKPIASATASTGGLLQTATSVLGRTKAIIATAACTAEVRILDVGVIAPCKTTALV